jgi:hypothetical protein
MMEVMRVPVLLVMVVSASSTLSCFSTRKYDVAHETRVSAIDADYGGMEREAQQSAWQLLSIIDSYREFLVEIKPGSDYAPAERVEDRIGYASMKRGCEDFERDAKAQTDPVLRQEFAKIAQECWKKMFDDIYVPALVARYNQADMKWVVANWKPGTDLEALCAYSHNTAILRDIATKRGEVEARLNEQLARIRQHRDRAVMLSAEQRDMEVSNARAQYRANMAAIASSMQAASSTSNGTTQTSTPAGGCRSDFDCGVGNQCVKSYYASTGQCAKSVNEYGVQSYDLPRLDSVNPNFRQNTDCQQLGCPIGFRCDLQSGVCMR